MSGFVSPTHPLPRHTQRERELFSQSTLDILFLPTHSCPPTPEISNLVRTAFSFLPPSMSTKSRILPRITYHGKWHDCAKNGPLFFFFPFGRGGGPTRSYQGSWMFFGDFFITRRTRKISLPLPISPSFFP